MANIISHAYKGCILSTLTIIRYNEPLDTIEQMVDSDLPLFVIGGAPEYLASTDPRDMVKLLNARSSVMPFNGTIDEKYLKMYKRKIKLRDNK